MARGINKVIILGTLGRDPEIRYMPSGAAVADLSVATNERWKDKETGEIKERTEWHRVTLFGRQAEVAGEYLAKGRQVYVEGQNRTEKWQDQDGNDRYTTKCIAREMQLIGGRDQGESQGASGRPAEGGDTRPAKQGGGSGPASEFDDDIPFARKHWMEG